MPSTSSTSSLSEYLDPAILLHQPPSRVGHFLAYFYLRHRNKPLSSAVGATDIQGGASNWIVGLGWLWPMMFKHNLVQLLGQFCQFHISPSRTRQKVEQLKQNKLNPAIRADAPPCKCQGCQNLPPLKVDSLRKKFMYASSGPRSGRRRSSERPASRVTFWGRAVERWTAWDAPNLAYQIPSKVGIWKGQRRVDLKDRTASRVTVCEQYYQVTMKAWASERELLLVRPKSKSNFLSCVAKAFIVTRYTVHMYIHSGAATCRKVF